MSYKFTSIYKATQDFDDAADDEARKDIFRDVCYELDRLSETAEAFRKVLRHEYRR